MKCKTCPVQEEYCIGLTYKHLCDFAVPENKVFNQHIIDRTLASQGHQLPTATPRAPIPRHLKPRIALGKRQKG
jgi:hypothetical protein